jgi:hypothetical protein
MWYDLFEKDDAEIRHEAFSYCYLFLNAYSDSSVRPFLVLGLEEYEERQMVCSAK